jgi:hypothetical protein
VPEADLLELFVARLDEIAVSYLVTGSVAATLYGEPRATHDIDLIVDLTAAGRDALSRAFPAAEFYLPPPEVVLLESRREGRGHFNIIHLASGLKADVFLVGDDEIHAWAFRNARHYPVGKLEVRVAPPEYVIVRKLEFYREGGSPKHLRDIRAMLSLSPELIDMPTLEDWVQRRGLSEPWAEVRAEDPVG